MTRTKWPSAELADDIIIQTDWVKQEVERCFDFKNQSIAIIVGPNRIDGEIAEIIERHDRTILIEPLPDACEAMAKQIGDNDGIRIVQAACGKANGTATLNIYNKNGASSSLGTCSVDSLELYSGFDLGHKGSIEVPVINLADFCRVEGIDRINTLVTDAQGMDLTILRTMADWLERSLIDTIQCEADGDGVAMYKGVPNNSESGFDMLFSEFPQYVKSRLPHRVTWNPDLVWKLT